MSILITASVDCEYSGNSFDMISTFTNDLCELYKIWPNYLVPNLNSAVYKKATHLVALESKAFTFK